MNTKEFLDELTKLSQKYGIYVSACGCCNSPWLLEYDPEKKYWNDELMDYDGLNGSIENFHYVVDESNEGLEFKKKSI